MPLIITATDFSEIAENAINYACNLASDQNAQVVIIHSFMIPVMFSDIPMPGSLITDAQNDAEEQMKILVNNMKLSHPGLDIEGKVIYGDTIDALDEYSEENNKPWLIIVGNSSPGENNYWTDSTLMATFKKLAFPVLAIPPSLKYQLIRKICFAFDNKHKGNDTALQQVKDLTLQFNAQLHVLNIQPAEDGRQSIDEHAKNRLADANPEYHFVYDADNIDNEIQDYINKNDIDWLIMIPRKHSFFEGLFHKSHTRNIAHHSHIPILALHESQE